MKKTTQLKNLICSNGLSFIMEAHNGLSAKIVEETGFKGMWGSGLSISAAMGVRDNNEASWTQVLEVIEFMSDATTIPMLLDGDTGYGNFNNMRRLVTKLEQREIAGVCIEDKLFPKTNSFIGGETQPLADMDEFCGKIKAAKDTQKDDDFVVVARIEAFIAGWGLSEALRRAEAYRLAGADAILVHSKKANSSDIEAFMAEWANRHPVVIVPTKYYSTPTDKFRDLGINTVIWANHNMRAAITAIQNNCKDIYDNETLQNVEGKIVSVAEIFRIQGADELKEAEKVYLPTSGKEVNSIILAASQGSLNELTTDIPKTLLKVGEKSILHNQVDTYNRLGIKDISVVRGFAKDKVTGTNLTFFDNDDHENTKDLYSLYLAKEKMKELTVISYGDIVFKDYILNELLNDENDITIVVDADFEHTDDTQDFVKTDKGYSKKVYFEDVKLDEISNSLSKDIITGEFIGLWKVSGKGIEVVQKILTDLSQREDFKNLSVSDLFSEVVKEHRISVKFIKGSWLDVDTIVDLEKAKEL
ncbi:MAG: phosphoenolpyruvate mutase [Desulfobacterales bacterium]|nr:phosphoenolpyruvate mutase [Desulfobacterales bacterium]